MKKILAIVLALAVVLVCFAACGNKTKTDATPTDAESTAPVVEDLGLDAVGLLNAVFATYAEENSFALCGGDEANINYEGPGKYDVALAEELNVVAHLPATQNANIEEAANVMNMMNANSFTGAAYLLKEGTDVATFAADFKADLDNARWMCGFPEKFIVVKSGDFVVSAYGVADIMDYFKTTVSGLEGFEVVLEGNVEG